MMVKATEIRRGMVITMEGVNYVVVDFAHHTPGNLRAMVQTKLRKLSLPLVERAVITAPGEQAIRTCDRMAGEGADDNDRQRRHRRPADQSQNAICPLHDSSQESRRRHEGKNKRTNWWIFRG